MRFVIILAICCFAVMLYAFEHKENRRTFDKIANSITIKTADQLEQKYGVVGSGFGLSAPEGKVKKMILDLRIYHILTFDEARKLLVNCVEEYIFEINNNPEIQSFLEEVPFTKNQVEVGLFILSEDGGEIFDPNVAVASLYKGEIEYNTNDPINKYKYKNTIVESYEEAKKIVEEQCQ
jgi:hypothetical protein